MSKDKHTPFFLNEYLSGKDYAYDVFYFNPELQKNKKHLLSTFDKEFAEYIVKACNAYPKLVDCLKQSRTWILADAELYADVNEDTIKDLLTELGEL